MAQAVEPELPSPFITSQKDVGHSSAPQLQQHISSLPRQAGPFAPQPVDSPVEFETVLHQPNGGSPAKIWGLASRMWANRSFIGNSSVTECKPCPVRVIPLSSGWYDGDSFSYPTQSAIGSQDQQQHQDQQQAEIYQPCQYGQRVLVRESPVEPILEQEPQQSRNFRHKHSSKLHKLLSSLHSNALTWTNSRKHCGGAHPCAKRSHSSRGSAQPQKNCCATPGPAAVHGADAHIGKSHQTQRQWTAGSPAESSSTGVSFESRSPDAAVDWWPCEPQQHCTPAAVGPTGSVVGSWPRSSRSRSPSPSRRDSNSPVATAVVQSRCSLLLEELLSVGEVSEDFSDSTCLSMYPSAAVAAADIIAADPVGPSPKPGGVAATRSVSFDGAGQGAAKQRRSCHHRRRSSSASAASRGGGLRSSLDGTVSLRTALVALEHASAHAGRFIDKMSQGLARVTSFTPMTGILRQPVGKEVYRDWELGPELGRGASCVTRLAFARHNGCTAACKTIHKSGIFRSAAVKAAVLGVQRELTIMQHTSGHPNVVQLKGVYEDSRSLHLLLEWCGGGSLTQLAEKAPGGRCGEGAAAAVAKAVLEVLAVCHSKGVIHCDIKLDNLLLSRPIDDPQQISADMVKVTDFGISVPFIPGQVGTAEHAQAHVYLSFLEWYGF
eukprot:GHUV01005782.1.p1 GENE.GHUV01005782.1~~GHUV01005782.1.p1  ORF type:complete len:663 (+),score=191.05 GHUV01005782.1:383-2371(+)